MKNSTTAFLFVLLAITFSISACGDNDKDSPPRGWACVEAVDQNDETMRDCHFDREVTPHILAQNAEFGLSTPDISCKNGYILFDAPGTHTIDAVCDNLVGHINVDLQPGENNDWESRLFGSFCSNDKVHVVYPDYPRIHIKYEVGFSEEARCSNWIGTDEDSEIKLKADNILLDCTEEYNCDPQNGRKYLRVIGNADIYSGDLILEANFEKIEHGKEIIVIISVRENGPHEQEVDIPIIIRNTR